MARLFVSIDKTAHLAERPIGELDRAIHEDGWIWLDGGVDDVTPLLRGELALADADVEDVLTETELPKFEARPEYLFVIAHTPPATTQRFRTTELDIFVAERFVITIHRDRAPAIETLIDGLDTTEISTSGELLGRLLKTIAGRYVPLVSAMDELIDQLEDLAIAGDPSGLDQLQALRRDAIRLRRVLAPMRESARRLGASDHPLISKSLHRQVKAAADDFSLALDGVDTARLLLAAVLDTYRATVAERMNEVMKVLTVFSAIVLPLGLMAGIYGMNFANMPELGLPWAYFALLGLMAVVGLGLWVYFARRGFIGGPRVPRVDRVVTKGLGAVLHLTMAPTRAILGTVRGTDEPPAS